MKLYIIDDEEVSIFIISNRLAMEGIISKEDITSFLSAEQALEVLINSSEENLPDIILLDLAMPDIDGWQFLEGLEPIRASLEKRSRIYILTSSIIKADKERAKNNPLVSGFMHKPISTEDIKILQSGEGARIN